MTVSKHTETLETLAQEREKAKQQLNYWTQREKILSQYKRNSHLSLRWLL